MLLKWLQEKLQRAHHTQPPDEEDILLKEQRLSAKIGDLEHDYEQVNQWRQQNRNDIMKLQRAITRVGERDFSKVEKRTLKDLRRYERMLRKQVEDLIQIMRLLRELIKSEYYEILYDLRRPLAAFEDFFDHLSDAFSSLHSRLSPLELKNLQSILDEIHNNYESIVAKTIDFLEGDFRYYRSIGMEFYGFEERHETDYPLETHLKERGKIKQSINGKTQYIVTQIHLLKENLRRTLQRDTNLFQILDNTLTHLEEQFEGMSKFCIKRIEISDSVIIEAIILQQNHYTKIFGIRTEVEGFLQQLRAEQERIDREETSNWKTAQMVKRINLFNDAQKDIAKKLEDIRREFSQELEEVRQEDLVLMHEEVKQAQVEKTRVRSFARRFAATSAGLAAALSILAISHQTIQQPAPPQQAKPAVTAGQQAGQQETDQKEETAQETQQEQAHDRLNVGDTTVHIEVHSNGQGPVYFNMHDDENTSVNATRQIVDHYGGTLVELQHTGGRFVTFNLDGKTYQFDPNRIFTDKGIKKTLQKYGPYSQAAHEEVRKFAQQLLQNPALRNAKIIVAVHNNTEHKYSAVSYQRELRSDAADVSIAEDGDPDDFFFVTDKSLFHFFQRHGYSVVLQDNRNVQDDGSLSVYCAQNGIGYVNVEAQHGHTGEQRAMLETLNKGINQQTEVVSFSEQRITQDDVANLSPVIPKLYQKGAENKYHVIIDGQQQSAFLIHQREIVGKFRTSTASAGFGEEQDSWKTPRGLMRVHKVIGNGMPRGTEFVARQAIYDGNKPRTRTIHTAVYDSEEDVITSRVIWLEGAERRNSNTLGRHIYLHGTNEEGLLGQPASHGCPRLSNNVVIQLADHYVTEGSYVYIMEGQPVHANVRVASHHKEMEANSYVQSFINTLYQEPQDERRYHLLVDGPNQQMHIVHNRKVVETTPISTSKYGYGYRPRSGRTPEGLHKITQIVGEGMPIGTVISGGRVRKQNGKPKVIPVRGTKGKAAMTSRVIYIHGLEPANRSSLGRGIRIHGTNQEEKLGEPGSIGCVRVGNEEIIKLADKLLSEGSKVFVIGNAKLAELEHEDSREELVGK